MNMKLIGGTAVTGLVLAGGIAGMVSAQSAATATGLSEEQIIEIALMEVAGDVQDVELENHRGMQYFEVEVLAADGSEMEVKIDAESGEVLKVSAEGEECGGKGRGDKHDDDDEA